MAHQKGTRAVEKTARENQKLRAEANRLKLETLRKDEQIAELSRQLGQAGERLAALRATGGSEPVRHVLVGEAAERVAETCMRLGVRMLIVHENGALEQVGP